MTLKRGEIKDYWYGALCRVSTDPPLIPPDPHVLFRDVPQSSRTMGSLVLEGSRGMARERGGGGGNLIRTRM